MVTKDNIQKLLNELAEKTAEEVRPGFAEDIKNQIPQRFIPHTSHKSGMDTISIIIDLRISKLAAAAAIIIATVLFANYLGDRDSTGDGIYQDGRMLMKYYFGGSSTDKPNILLAKAKYEHLLSQGEKVVYYGDYIDSRDANNILMHLKLPDGKYRITFGDLRVKTVTAEQLVQLQARMLQRKTK